MTRTRRLAVLLAAISLLLVELQPAALGASRTDHVRYADDSCPGKAVVRPNYGHCAPWRLRLRSGRVLRLTDARLLQGSRIPVPIALSPHGSQVAYIRLSDDALVIRDVTTGAVRAVPGVKWSPVRFAALSLSPGGRFVLLRHHAGQQQVVDTGTGQVRTFPFTVANLSFSPDNRYVIARRLHDDTGREPDTVMVYATGTWTEVRRSLTLRLGALRMDGALLAYLDPAGARPAIRFQDVATGAPAGSALTIPAGETGRRLVWDRAGHLDLLTEVAAKTHGNVLTLRWRRANAGMRILDTFTTTRRAVVPPGSMLSG
ncbi:TolB family protein [Nonomuraea zeae]|uniref:WD40 repeat domain-containing protein n=1 Tax=Nonomuraea zeae TaxID=1642303 RepID=A0A5S4FPZ3_9ACTN|nr:hypothetical protein [Nonomuraea zeae]TMR22758.1 hypothetical protein ETD85_48970 [Nonomuraea zeae]